jgi:ketol-acid reductoisomerase
MTAHVYTEAEAPIDPLKGKEIQHSTFAHRWLDENEMGRPNFTKYREDAANDPMEKVGQDLRALMNKQGLTTTTG